ncbi:unnamed protein product [Protopolystoma xenopodis]|uniref:Uncharacterized protein n=1 Tax=Protopolystoma xenopodis TaxID=117903 RepID=A0A448XA95_9PLAT|nr:unnamed protein product [Protopolystoma xenopodis]
MYFFVDFCISPFHGQSVSPSGVKPSRLPGSLSRAAVAVAVAMLPLQIGSVAIAPRQSCLKSRQVEHDIGSASRAGLTTRRPTALAIEAVRRAHFIASLPAGQLHSSLVAGAEDGT